MLIVAISTFPEPVQVEAMSPLTDRSEHWGYEPLNNHGEKRSWALRLLRVARQAGLAVDWQEARRMRCRINQDLPLSLTRLVEARLEREISGEEATG
jgi:hypothetical protein